MSKTPKQDVRIFDVETRFQKMSCRVGGISREKAITNAQHHIDEVKPEFDEWFDKELRELANAIRLKKANVSGALWIEGALFHASQLRDVGTTMGFELLSFIANALCEILDAVNDGAKCNMELITCHVDALFLARQEQYRNLRPDQLPELSAGLRKIAELSVTRPAKVK